MLLLLLLKAMQVWLLVLDPVSTIARIRIVHA